MFCESHRALPTALLIMFCIVIYPLLQVCHPISNDARIAYHRGYLFQASEKYDSALVYYTRTLELEPKLAEVYIERGVVNDHLERTDSALADFSKALEMEPTNGKAYYDRGLTYAHRGEYDRSILDYNKSEKLNRQRKDNYQAYQFIAEIMERWGYHFPIDSLITARAIGLHLERGEAFQKKKDYGLAIADFNGALKQDSNCVEAYLRRGSTYEAMGDYERALADLNKAVYLNAYYGPCYAQRGSVFYNKGDLDQAIKDCNKAIELRPNGANAFFTKALAYEKKGRIKEAVEAFKFSVQYALPRDTVLIKKAKLKISELEK